MTGRKSPQQWQKFAIPVLCILCKAFSAWAADDAANLRNMDNSLAQQIANNQFRRQLVLVSVESPTTLKGDIYAELNYPFAIVNAALNDPVKGPANWCDVLILHINTKYCHASSGNTNGNDAVLSMSIGKKVEQQLADTDRMQFRYQATSSRADYFKVDLDAASGPLNTSNYDITLEAIPIKANRTFLHLSYAYSYGMLGRVAMKSYLATIGRNKVGFTIIDARPSATTQYIGGVRGVVERNAMRYYLAIDAYLGALSRPAATQLDQRLTNWFTATEQYPRQLHEVEREDYMRMKRSEYARQQTLQ
jgi:hypothetical protein